MIKRNQKGLSLIEILIALFLASLLYLGISAPSGTERNKLERAIGLIEKSINFSVNESILRNTVTRIHFDLSKERPEFNIEYSADKDFLVELEEVDLDRLSVDERKAKIKEIKERDQQFKTVPEFEEHNFKIEEDIFIIGVGSNLKENLVTNSIISLHTYPSGERDSGLIIIAGYEEVIALKITPYKGGFERVYVIIDQSKDIEEEYERIRSDLFDKWKNN